MSNKLFVGGLSWDTSDDSLRNAFQQFGQVREARVILDRDTGRSRGFGFVTFGDASEAEKAVEQMNGAMLDGRSIRVNVAEERPGPRRDGPGGGPRRDYGPRPEVQFRGRRPREGEGGGGGEEGGGGGGGGEGGGYRGGGGGGGGYGGGGYRGGGGGGYRGGGEGGGGGGGYRGGGGGGYGGGGGGYGGGGGGAGFRGGGGGGYGGGGPGGGGGYGGGGPGGGGGYGGGGPGGGGGGGYGGGGGGAGGGFRGGPPRGPRPGGPDLRSFRPRFGQAEPMPTDDRDDRRRSWGDKKKKPTHEEDPAVGAADLKREKRASGKTWRDYTRDDDDAPDTASTAASEAAPSEPSEPSGEE